MSYDMNKQEPIAWAVMQPDSYRVFASYNQALEHREDCAGGDIVPLYKEEDQVQKITDYQKSPITITEGDALSNIRTNDCCRKMPIDPPPSLCKKNSVSE